MAITYTIRADYDSKSIVVYQAYNKQIALSAIQNQTFQASFEHPKYERTSDLD